MLQENVDIEVIKAINDLLSDLATTYLKLDCSNDPLTDNLDLGSNKIINLLDPTLAQDAATKAYVDAAGGGGEINTASNQGVGGIGLYDTKIGVDLQFRNINAGSNKITVVLDAGNKEVDIDIDEANLILDGNTLQIDGINSDAAAFSFTTGGDVTFNQNLIIPSVLLDYIDIVENAVPPAPPANTLRLYVEDFKGFSFFSFVDSTGMHRKIVRDSVFVGRATEAIGVGQGVYASGSVGNVPRLSLAKADVIATMPAIGIAIEDIAINNFGRVMQVGLLENMDTSAFAEGDILYISATIAGDLVNVAPLYPNIRQEIATVLVSGVGNGAIQVVARSVFNEGIIDHGGLLGLIDDDHIQYLLIDGTRAMTGNLDMGANNIIVGGTVDGIDISAISLSNMPVAAAGNIDCGAQAITNVGNVDGVDVSAIVVFTTISCPAGTNPVADLLADTLNITATGDIIITGNAGTDTIDFSVTKYTDLEAVAAVAAADNYITNNANDVMTGDLTVNNLITAGNVDGVDISAISITNMPTAVNNWKVYCTNGAGVMTEIATGAAGTVLTGNGVAAAPSFQAAAGGGDAFKTITGITNDVVADAVADTLTLVAAGGLTIVGTAATDTITFTNTITQYTDALARAACVSDAVYGAGWNGVLTIAASKNAVYDKIAAMDILIAANTTVAEVEAVITAELVNGQSIDNAIDALINAHNVANRHIDHSAVTITAGVGLSGGGTIAANRTIDCDITQYTDAMARAAVSLDNAFDVGKIINGATTLANAMQVGDANDRWNFYARDGHLNLNSSFILMPESFTAAQLNDAIIEVSANGGGIVQLPEGTHNMGTTVINMKNGVWLRGCGWSATTIQYTNTSSGAILIDAQSYIRISNLRIYCSNGSASIGIFITNTSRYIYINDNYIESTNSADGHGIYVEYNKTIQYVWIKNNWIKNFAIGIRLRSGDYIWIQDNLIAGQNIYCIRGKYHVYYLHIEGNYMYHAAVASAYGIIFEGTYYFTFNDNICRMLSCTTGVRLHSGGFGIVDGNVIKDATTKIGSGIGTCVIGDNETS